MNKSEPETWKEAVAKCKATLQRFVPEHERIDLKIHFYIFPPRYSDPIIEETPEAALKEAVAQDLAETTLEILEEGWDVNRRK